MSKLEVVNTKSEVYRLEDSSHQVSTAKSQFAEKHDVDYSDVQGSKIKSPGRGRSYPALCVVVEVGE